MLYYLYEWNHAALSPLRAAADATRLFYQNPLNPLSITDFGRAVAAGAELFERTTRVYGKPEFGLDDTVVDGQHVRVNEVVVAEKPFCRLLRFEREVPRSHKTDPRFLIVAPLSGHYATLLRGTVEALLPYADVHITDWKDARKVPLRDGKFDLSDYTQYVIDFLRQLGPDTHVLAVCQPAVPVLMAVAAMEKMGDDCAPATMTLMGGPIDTRVNPTAVNRLAETKGIDWFRDNVIMTVPFPQPGFMRRVYPGFLQLTGFMSMNLDRHMIAHKEFFWHLVKDDGDSADKHRTFYDEYNAVMDMSADFYLQTVEEVFIKHSLPKGEMLFNGEPIDLTAIKRVALLTVEGENDDISGVGQTEAAQDLCSSIPDDMRVHYVQPKVGHYGVFNGSRFRSEIVPRIVDFALTHGSTHSDARLPKGVNTPHSFRKIGAHEERHAKADQLGQSLVGGETGLATPLMGMANPFAAGERMMRAMAKPAEEMFQKGLAVAQGAGGSMGVGAVSVPVIMMPARDKSKSAEPVAKDAGDAAPGNGTSGEAVSQAEPTTDAVPGEEVMVAAPMPAAALEVGTEAADTANDVAQASAEVAEKTMSATADAAETTAEAVSDAASDNRDAAAETAEATVDAAGEVTETAADTAETVATATTEAATEASEATADAATAATETAAETAEDAAAATTEAATEATEAAAETAATTAEAGSEVTEAAAEAAEEAATATTEVATETTEAAAETAEEAATATTEAATETTEAAAETAEKAMAATGEAAKKASEAAVPAGEAAKDGRKAPARGKPRQPAMASAKADPKKTSAPAQGRTPRGAAAKAGDNTDDSSSSARPGGGNRRTRRAAGKKR